jgi:hypothetical protein
MNSAVVIGFAESLAGIESAWCLTAAGFEVHAFTRRHARPAVARGKNIRVIPVTPPEEDAFATVTELSQHIRELRPAAMLPLDDHAVWLSAQLAGEVPAVAGPTGQQASLALDKRGQLRLAASAGLAVPLTAQAVGPPPGGGPWMVKPALAVELRDGRLCRPSGGVASTTGQIARIAEAIGGPILVQPLLNGVGEGVFGLAVRGTATALSAHQRIRMMNPRGSGSSACRSVPVPDDVIGPVRKLISESDWHGLFMVELLRDAAGRPWFIELNGRAWGSMALARYRGYRYPAWAVQAALDERFRPTEPASPPDITARHLGREIVHLGTVLARGGAPRLATARAVLTVHRSDRWYNYRRGEERVFAADTMATVRAQFAPRIVRHGARFAKGTEPAGLDGRAW